MPVNVPEVEIDGVEYEGIHIEESKVVVAHVFPDKVVFNFEDALFSGAMNLKNKNEGGFIKTALCEYLNMWFIKVFFDVDDCLIKNNDGNKVSLPTEFEVFGESEYGVENCNWTKDGLQFDLFKDVKCRIRCQHNQLTPWWEASPRYGSTTDFCIVNASGGVGSNNAVYLYGVVPVFAVGW
jgi:hypothetical protein